ncbi:EAL domain-containing protein [methane-oxidizing endosymbiont of Gigantopelta aegis]|uniref:EAL domain-containing protein n=1 Tax=methane-oxidizing endosymbiont of Gigantopelta aegis TaxID=2794938 RepID=UPI0018DB7126|nr:EAL domain-containing protein [methane-oxidizing endosymbiont of Gigantopelta aegis]
MTDIQIDHFIEALRAFRQKHLPDSLTSEQLVSVDTMVRAFLKVVLQPEQTAQAAEDIAQTALELKLPYALLLGEINALKKIMLAYFKADYDSPLDAFEQIDRAFEHSKNIIARRYLHTLAQANDLFPVLAKPEKQYLLQIYDRWFRTLRKALTENDLDAFKHIANNNIHFIEALNYPETLIVCLDPLACTEVHDAHKNIMRQAALLYVKLLQKHYEQAYLLYTDLVAGVKQLSALLATLYFNYETDRMSLFLNFMENLGYIHKQAYLTLFNVRNLNQINQLKGEDVGDALLEQVDKQLQNSLEKNRSHLAYTRGLMGDFYVLTLGLTADETLSLLQPISDALAKQGIELTRHTINLTHLKLVDRTTIRQLIRYLHGHTLKENQLLDDEASLEPINVWIKAQVAMSVNLHQLLEQDQLDIHLQPLLNTQNSNIAAFEALGRLNTDDGILSAGLFIDKLIELNLIERFDTLILNTIARYADALEQLNQPLFINCSPASLNSPAYQQHLKDMIQGPLKNITLVIELTEQTMLNSVEQVIGLHQETGVTFAIDDFGTGFSSLKTVVELAEAGAANFLKIDGSLTCMIGNSSAIQRLFKLIYSPHMKIEQTIMHR